MAYKTPGVYIVEKNAFPNSVVEVATAVPAFIGYTEKADNKGTSLRYKPWRITSMSQFIDYFGGAPAARFDLVTQAPNPSRPSDFSIPKQKATKSEEAANSEDSANSKNSDEYWLLQNSVDFILYSSMRLFYQNGGGACYIVSVGDYSKDIEMGPLSDGVITLKKEQEPTMVVVPEAIRLPESDCVSVQQAILQHCGEVMKNRFAILDIYDGFRDRSDPNGDCVAKFRDILGVNNLDFAAAYYPWLETTIFQESALNFVNVSNADVLQQLLKADMKLDPASAPLDGIPKKNFDEKTKAVEKVAPWANEDNKYETSDDMAKAKEAKEDNKYKTREDMLKAQLALHQLLGKFSPLYVTIMGIIAKQLNLLPPSAAMAGIYTSVDNSRGVWKAPANVSLNGVIKPAVNISHEEQEDLNVTTAGKSINAIRAFIGSGVLVWGARTLDGNSLDWRYINVRRTMIMLEESLRLAMGAYVFEPNTANTWVTVKGMATSFLTGIWKRGGLAGTTTDDAFSVFVGLGETMTGDDILEGRMNVTVLVALSRPAEFIEITFQQQMQKS